MPTLNPNIAYGVSRIRSIFRDGIGVMEERSLGTGFWVKVGNTFAFVTNAHNVDPGYKHPALTGLRLSEVEIELRATGPTEAGMFTKFFRVANAAASLFQSRDADCALFWNPQLADYDSAEYAVSFAFNQEYLADQTWFSTKLQIMDEIFFLGFPVVGGRNWFDDNTRLPIARSAIFACFPGFPFEHEDIRTTDTLLVSGLSFSGSSGSPAFVPERGIRPGGDLVDASYRPAKLAGLMSGHWWEDAVEPPLLRHSGLSYLTRSTSILSLLQEAAGSGREGDGPIGM